VTVTLRDARHSEQDRDWIRTVYRDYLSDLSTSRSGVFPVLGEFATRHDELLAGWFVEAGSLPFVILQTGARVGFARIVRSGGFRRQDCDYQMSEFFVLGRARGRGIGRAAATLLFSRFDGDWEVLENEQNRAAVRFWRTVIGEAAGGRFRELRCGGEVRHRFRTGPDRPLS